MKTKTKMLNIAILCLFLAFLIMPLSNLTTVFANDNGNGSTIAGVNVQGLDEKEIENVLTEAVNEWLSEEIKVVGGGMELTIDPSNLQFDIPATISEYRTLTDKAWYAFWESPRVVHIPLNVVANENLKTEIASIPAWEKDETYNQLISQASFLKEHQVEAKVMDLNVFNNERLALTIRDIPSNAFGLDELVTLLDGVMINPGEEFSYIEIVDENIKRVNSESLNFVSSLLYDAVLQTEYEILERHQGSVIPTTIELGKEASINSNLNEDFKFINNTKYVGKINASLEGNSLKIDITSSTKQNEVFVSVDKEVLSPRIIYRYSNDLPIGHEQLIQEGSEGYRVVVNRTISGNGRTDEQHVSRDYYPPVNQVILKSSKTPEEVGTGSNSDTTNTTDPNLEIDLDGDGLPDLEVPNEDYDEESAPSYDKGGNIITP